MSKHRPSQSNTPWPVFLIIGVVCGVLGLFGFTFHILLTIAAIALINRGIETLVQNDPRQRSQYIKYKELILAILCFIFGGVSGMFDLAGIFFLLRFVADLLNNKHQVVPPTPRQGRSSRNYSRNASYTQSSQTDQHGFYANTNQNTSASSGRSYTRDRVQPAQPQTPPQPERTANQTRPNLAPYQKVLNQLQRYIHELDQREETVSKFLDDFFAGSTVSKSRYLATIQNAHARLETNYEKARQAVQLFGNSEPTPERMEILNRYAEDSKEIMQKVERVINELITVQQNDVISDGDVLDSLLDDLADTTSYYQRSSYKKDTANNSGSDASNQSGPHLQMPG